MKANGQVVNTGPVAAEFVRVTMGIYDEAGALIAVEDGYAELRQIPANGVSPFSLDFFGVQRVPAHKEVFVSGSRMR